MSLRGTTETLGDGGKWYDSDRRSKRSMPDAIHHSVGSENLPLRGRANSRTLSIILARAPPGAYQPCTPRLGERGLRLVARRGESVIGHAAHYDRSADAPHPREIVRHASARLEDAA